MTVDRFHAGDIVQHFKRELVSSEEMKAGMYLYEIIDTDTMHTETGERLVVYRSLYTSIDENGVLCNRVFARPYSMFCAEVDHEKYPSVKQKYRFQTINH